MQGPGLQVILWLCVVLAAWLGAFLFEAMLLITLLLPRRPLLESTRRARWFGFGILFALVTFGPALIEVFMRGPADPRLVRFSWEAVFLSARLTGPVTAGAGIMAGLVAWLGSRSRAVEVKEDLPRLPLRVGLLVGLLALSLQASPWWFFVMMFSEG